MNELQKEMCIRDRIYIDAKDAYFLKSKRRPSQIREMSDMSHTITRIRDVNEFINAVSVKERIAACLAVLIKKTIPTGTSLGPVSYTHLDVYKRQPGDLSERAAR